MTTELDWSHDFCLSCDRQIAEGAYCSQACRLADLEKAGSPEPHTPINFSSSASSTASYASSSAGFYLPPAVNFAAYKTTAARLDSAPTSPHYSSTAPSYFHHASTPSASYVSAPPPKRSLSPSSSRSSLSSVSSAQPTQGLSAQAAHELKGYVSCFDQTRDRKRRLTQH